VHRARKQVQSAHRLRTVADEEDAAISAFLSFDRDLDMIHQIWLENET
jgi:hypothetical protein